GHDLPRGVVPRSSPTVAPGRHGGVRRSRPAYGTLPTEGLTLDFKDPEGSARTVVAVARHQPIDAVVGVDDTTAVVAAAISAALGLPHNSVAATSAARNKHRMRELLRKHGVPVPRFARFSLQEDPG